MAAVEDSGTRQDKDRQPMGSDPSQARARLAVLIPVFNGQAGLERSLSSLCDSREPFDVFVVDDGSDPPIEPPSNLPFSVRLIRLPENRGIASALNAGLREILPRGYQYVARQDAGDFSLPGRLAAQVAFLDAHPDHAVVGTHADFVEYAGARLFLYQPPTEHDALMRRLRRRNGIVHASVVMRSDCIADCGGYDERFCGAEDYELWRRLGRRYKLANLPEVLFKVEVHHVNSITARPFRSATRLRVQMRYFEPLSIHSYVGVLRSAFALLASRRLILRTKKWYQRPRIWPA